MNSDDFRKYGHDFVDWLANYFENIEEYHVLSDSRPGEIFSKLPNLPPEESESMNKIMDDFNKIIMPGITHWQHPSFHGYFPANNSYPSILAEILTSGIGAQCMMWQTSPAAAELEEKVMIWLREMIGLPSEFSGVIQDTASTATLVALLTAREKGVNYRINEKGFNKNQFRIYCSTEAHSSIEKAVKIAGFGKENLIKIGVDKNFAMMTLELEETINRDISNNFLPLCVVGAFGTTGSTAVDDINSIGKICNKYNIWFHVDAAYVGSALILEEYRYLLEGVDNIDSFVFNPHKWMMTNFDCSAYFVKDVESLVKTFEIMPEYLKTKQDNHVNNYRDWGIQLGRRFRALKLWFVIRTYGVEGLRNKIRNDIDLTEYAVQELLDFSNVEILAPVNFNVICFRFNPGDINEEKLNSINELLLNSINRSRKVFLTHTKLNDRFTIRLVIGQTNVRKIHVDKVLNIIRKSISEIGSK